MIKTFDTHMSIDIETMDVDPSSNAAVIAIGAVIFNVREIFSEFEVLIHPSWAPGSRGHDTRLWWAAQEEEIRNRMFSGRVMPDDACRRFTAFCTFDTKFFWANPTRFDFTHMRSMYQACEQEFPFKFFQERDLSTLRWAARQYPNLKSELSKIRNSNRAAHDALSDARAQAKAIQAVMMYCGLS